MLEGSSYSPQADIYAVGVIFYEMLSGKSPSANEKPTPLGDLRPDISRDLTDAVMGCLEKGPDWRPKDLSYLLQVVRTMRSSGVKGAAARPAASPAPEPISRPTAARITPSSAPRRSSGSGARDGSSRSQVPLIAGVLVLLVGAGVGGYLWFQEPQGAKVAKGPVATPPPATPLPAATPERSGGSYACRGQADAHAAPGACDSGSSRSGPAHAGAHARRRGRGHAHAAAGQGGDARADATGRGHTHARLRPRRRRPSRLRSSPPP